eukprot:COSAG02_NODE_30106_length_557_cov_0.788210_1_plen_36_part_01
MRADDTAAGDSTGILLPGVEFVVRGSWGGPLPDGER